MILAITGTNTDVGKTIASAAIALGAQKDLIPAQYSKVIYCKPVQTGEPDGAGDMFTIATHAQIEVHEFARYPEPLAPNLSARRAGCTQLEFDEVVARIQALDAPDTLVLLEGAGGLMVRLADSFSYLALIKALGAPLLVVTSLTLGSLNSAELTVRMAQQTGINVLATLGGSYPTPAADAMANLAVELNEQELPVVTEVPYLGSLPAGLNNASAEKWQEAVSALDLQTLWQQLKEFS